MQQVPGVLVDRVNVAGNQSASQADFVGKGTYQSTYVYDGVNVTDQGANGFSSMYFDFDAFQELQIATGGSDLTLNSAGVTLNVVTKRGSNDFKGSALVLCPAPDPVGQHAGRDLSPGPRLRERQDAVRPRVRSGGRRPDHQRPGLVLGRRFAPGHQPRPHRRAFRDRPAAPEQFDARELEWQAQCAGDAVELGHLSLQPERQARGWARRQRQSPAGDDVPAERPGNNPEGRGCARLLAQPFCVRVLCVHLREPFFP